MTTFRASKYILSGSTPSSSKSLAHKLLISNGFYHPVGKGLFSLLPLGERVVRKLCNIIDHELEAIGAQKVIMPAVAPKELWEKSSRWDAMGPEMIRLKDRSGAELCLQPTAEEMCTQLVSQLPNFKKSTFPLLLYQTSEKFRDEMNPRFGLVRSRQFLMNDLYSFDLSIDDAQQTYAMVAGAYDNILNKQLELNMFKVRADSGVHGGRLSEEYHLPSSLEEDGIHYCSDCRSGSKKDEEPTLAPTEKCAHNALETFSTIEIAHTFQLGTKYSELLKARFSGNPLEMCCFGIGITRLIPATVEALSPSEDVLRLPKAIAPFDVAVVVSKALEHNVLVEMLISTLRRTFKGGILFDDRVGMNVGKRLKELNRLGIPRILVLGKVTEDSLGEATSPPRLEYMSCDAHQLDFTRRGELTLNELMQIIF